MALLIALLALALFFVSILKAACSRQLADEFKAWVPWFTRKIIRAAVARLPEDQRERYGEEWTSHTNEVPGEVGKLFVALGFLLAANRMTLSTVHPEDADQSLTKKRLEAVYDNVLSLTLGALFMIYFKQLAVWETLLFAWLLSAVLSLLDYFALGLRAQWLEYQRTSRNNTPSGSQ